MKLFSLKKEMHIFDKKEHFSPEICQMWNSRCNGSKLWYPHLISHISQIKLKISFININIFLHLTLNLNLSNATVPNADSYPHIFPISSRPNRKYKHRYGFKSKFKFVKCGDPVATVPNSETHITYLFIQIKLKISFVNINILKEGINTTSS